MHLYSKDEYESIGRYFKIREVPEGSPVVDDITWNDLDMDLFFKILDNTCSQNGGEYLYDMLRRPLIKEGDEERLKERGRIADLFSKKKDLRDRYLNLLNTGERISDDCFHERVETIFLLKEDSSLLHFICFILAVFSLVLIFVNPPIGFILFFISAIFNVSTYFRRKARITPYLPVFRHFIKLMAEYSEIGEVHEPELEGCNKKIREALSKLKGIRRNSWVVLTGKRLTGGILELPLDFIRIYFHIDLIKINNMLKILKKEKEEVYALLETTGFLDAMISLSIFRDGLRYYTEPDFTGSGISVKKGYHPLLKEPVPYDIENVSHMLLTGSNASGKSTFLKSLALSMIMAETLYTVCAESFSAECLEVLSSMSLRDDILKGDSLYVTEIKSIKRIVDRKKEGRKTAVFLDEVLKGTNTVERIASLSALLKGLKDSSLVFAATHDTPLTFILEDLFDNYHFDEIVRDGTISFPYTLEKGRTESSDAIMLLSVMGFDKETTDEAKRLSEGYMETGSWEKI